MPRRSASLAGVPMKHISLITLVFQNSLLILVMHYSRIMPPVNGHRYYTSTAVFLNELMKLSISLSMALYDIATHSKSPETATAAGLFGELARAVFSGDSWKMGIPALLYTLQNSLQYIGISNLDAATFQVTYQLKILTTALFSVTLLGKSLSPRRWTSLVLLMVGVAIVQIPLGGAETPVLSIKDLKDGAAFHSPRSIWDLKALGNVAAGQLSKRSATYEGIGEDEAAAHPQLDASIGLIAVMLACGLSGMAGVYFEKVLKDPKGDAHRQSVWVRNVQLSFYSLWPALLIGVLFKDGEQIEKTGFFTGYNWVVWLAITLQAIGGVVVALAVNYADNIAKNFATSISILVSFLASVFFFDFHITWLYLLGTATVVGATYLYNADPDHRGRPPPISVTSYNEKNNEPGYFDLESVPTPARTPIRGDGLSTSRPTTPGSRSRPRSPGFVFELTVSSLGHLSPSRYSIVALFFAASSGGPVMDESMDESIFQQLEELQRGAEAGSLPQSDGRFDRAQAPYPAHEVHSYLADDAHDKTVQEFADQPLTLDSFDEQLLRLPDPNSRYGQAARGRSRLSMMPASTQPSEKPIQDHRQSARGFERSCYAFNAAESGLSSSSAHDLSFPSSPTFKAGQRRPAIYGYEENRGKAQPDQFQPQFTSQAYYRPATIEQKQEVEMPVWDANTDAPWTRSTQPLPNKPASGHDSRATGPPIVQGIQLIQTRQLPDRFRSVFNFPLFNAVQSKCFATVYKANDNFVLSAPTGSGKTAVMELAICRSINGFANSSYKIVYQAPTKSLCSERQRDWQAKFGPLDLQCAELTGDTDIAQLRNVQHATIIVTTPEKWDSMTRKWKDHQKLMQMVKLFLIDEVHMLKDDRGATLEAVVSRMKSVGSNVRFIALSATVPNSEDIAKWLGKDHANAYLPAVRECFGEEFRPVRLQKHVRGYQGPSNDFAFDKVLGSKIFEVISKWSMRKPLMVFCFTRAACVETAKALATWWSSNGPKDRFWSAPRQKITVGDKDLLGTISSGVAFHHAGLQMQDRMAVEKGYLEGHINVICCTSTLAVGVNLPCHMVIIKNTVTYQNAATGGCKEYSDLEIMQMLGRAGRPQFDDSAVAVIMTRSQRVQHYERMLTGQEILESCLHRNLIDHLNAEIGLGTVTSVCSAKKWLTGTFLYVRLTENPEHYKLDSDAPGRGLDERLENICRKAISQLEHHDLVRADEKLQCTEFGDAMARYYLQFDTMKIFLSLSPKAKISEILSVISQAAEFREVRLRAGEKSMYKDLNKNQSIKFPIAVNLDLPAHKVSLIIQSVLGAVDLPSEEGKHRMEYQTAKSTILQHVHRLVRCIIDCQLHLNDAVTTRNALMLARSLAAQVWDDSPLHMKQLEGVGPVAVRKLAGAGIKSIGDIENSEAHRLEHILSRNPPYGAQLQERARDFPKLRVSLKIVGEPVIKKNEHVEVKMVAEIGFLNEKIPERFQRRAIYVCLLVETSDGSKVHFARISAKKLNKGQEIPFAARLTDATQVVRAYVMCDEVAGTVQSAVLKSGLPASAFPATTGDEQTIEQRTTQNTNTTRRQISKGSINAPSKTSDEFDDAGLDDTDLVLAENDAFTSIDELDLTMPYTSKKATTSKKGPSCQVISTTKPRQLSNGRWACNHSCKDKVNCKHLCCKEGLEHPPHPPKPRQPKNKDTEASLDPKQKQLVMNASKKTTLPSPLTSSTGKHNPSEETKEGRSLAKLHSSVKGRTPPVPLISRQSKPRENSTSNISTLPGSSTYCKGTKDEGESDYGNDAWDSNDLPDAFVTDSKQSAYPVSLGIQSDDLDTQQEDLFDIAFSGAFSPEKEKESHEGFIKDSLSEPLHGSTTDDAQMSGALADEEWGEGLFVSNNGQYAGYGLPGDLTVPKKRPAPSSDSKSDEIPTGTPTTTSKKQKLASPVSSVQQRNELDEIMQPAMQQTFAAIEDVEKQRPQSPGEMDPARAFFDEFLGNEHFNFIG
ncbi:P-loop containing nucleoside triphosphate hydrolase protein [Hortaea werneckii]|nr:P-loop containing nucleoside triphosphate hydrolase protein [Hortaea werneckii]